MDEDRDIPILMERSFLATCGALIYVKKGKMKTSDERGRDVRDLQSSKARNGETSADLTTTTFSSEKNHKREEKGWDAEIINQISARTMTDAVQRGVEVEGAPKQKRRSTATWVLQSRVGSIGHPQNVSFLSLVLHDYIKDNVGF